jgi:hypothetical protein
VGKSNFFFKKTIIKPKLKTKKKTPKNPKNQKKKKSNIPNLDLIPDIPNAKFLRLFSKYLIYAGVRTFFFIKIRYAVKNRCFVLNIGRIFLEF